MRILLTSLFTLALWSAAAQTGPSFSCAHVTSQVNKLICASSVLSALDRDLANVFGNMVGQPLDQKKLQSDQRAWLAALLKDCQDTACIQSRYQARLTELRDQSLQLASPASYAETRPFPAPVALFAAAQAVIGKPCSYAKTTVGPIIPGFNPAVRFLPIVLAGVEVVVREKENTRFAFLVSSLDSPGDSSCQIRDVVTLPASAVGDRFLQCSASDPPLTGFGVRNPNTPKLDGFWAVNADSLKIDRVPMAILGIQESIRCHQPETGE